MGSKGTQTTTQQSSANPAAMAAYYNLLTQAGNVAATPYQPYTGELVAPVNAQQQTGIGNINNYATAGIPGLQTAEGLFAGSANPLTQGQINQYYNPYQQEVVGATEQQFNQQNAIQQNQLLASQAAQGALGGTGTNVAQALLAGQQQTQEAPVIAGLEQQGYNTALQTAAQQYQQNPQAAAFGLGSSATALENAGLTGANAQVGAGSLEQQTQQALDQALYQQFENQLAYPFQTTQWLAGLDTGVGSQMGGTSSTTGPAPSLLSQLTGGLMGGIGMLGGTGAFGSSGWLSGMFSGASDLGATAAADPAELAMLAIKRGGRVNKRAQGGLVPHFAAGGGSTMYPQFGGGYGVATMPYAGGQSSVPGIGITHGHGPPAPPRMMNTDSSQQMWQNATKLAGSFRQGTQGGIGPIGTSPEAAQVVDAPAGTLISDNAIYQKGGRVIPFRKRGGSTPIRAGMGLASFVPHFDGGGAANDNETIIPEQFSPAQVVNQRWASPPVPASWYGSDPTPNILALEAYGQLSPMNPAQGLAPPADAGEAAAPANATPAPQPPMGGVGPAMGYAPQDGGQPLAAMPAPAAGAPMSVAPAAGVAPQQDRWGAGADIWPTLIAAGAGMLSSGSPFPGVGIGRGLQAGLGEMGALQQAHLAQQKEAREEQHQQQDIDLRVRQLNQQAKAEQDRLGQEAQNLAEKKREFEVTSGKGVNLPPGGTLVDPHTGRVIAQGRATTFDSDTLGMLADQYLAGDKTVFQNLGRGNQAAENIVALRNEIAQKMRERGVSGGDQAAVMANFTAQTAAARTAAVREANVATAVEEAKNTFPLALQASDNVPRTSWVPVNRAIQAWQAGTSSPELGRFAAANQAVITAYAQAMSRTGATTVNAREHAEQLLNTANGPEAYKAIINQLQLEMEAAKTAPETVRQAIMGRISGKSPEAAAPSGGAPAQAAPAQTKPATVIQNGHTYTLGPDGNYH